MEMFASFLVWLATLLASRHVTGKLPSTIWCSTENYFTGQTASITCHFPSIISSGVHMAFNPSDDTKNERDVLTCSITQLTTSKCTAKEGFVFRNFTKTSLTVEITAVTKNFKGQYSCQFVPPTETQTTMCSLEVNDKPAEKTISTPPISPVMWILVFLCLAILTVCIILLVRNYKTRRGDSVRKENGSTGREQPSNRIEDEEEEIEKPASEPPSEVFPLIQRDIPLGTKEQQQEEGNDPTAPDREDAPTDQASDDSSNKSSKIGDFTAKIPPDERYNRPFNTIRKFKIFAERRQQILQELLQNVYASCTKLKARPDFAESDLKELEEVMGNIDKLLSFIQQGPNN